MLSHMPSQEMGAGRRRLTRAVFKIIQCFIGWDFSIFCIGSLGVEDIYTVGVGVERQTSLLHVVSLSSSKREEWSHDCRRVRGSQVCWRMLLVLVWLCGGKSSFWEVSGVAS